MKKKINKIKTNKIMKFELYLKHLRWNVNANCRDLGSRNWPRSRGCRSLLL